MQNTLEKLLQAYLLEDKVLRILEVGAGTGGTTSYLVQTLAKYYTCANRPEMVDYCFTDISQAFLSKAQEKFSGYPFIDYEILNIERDPLKQGFEPASFDLVVASNVIHATQDIAVTLSNIKQLLASGGVIMLMEITRPMKWIELIFGLTDGWWLFTDTHLRQHHPLLTKNQWQSLYKSVGFEQFHCIDEASLGFEGNPTQSVLVARKPIRSFQSDASIDRRANKSIWLLLVNTDVISTALISAVKAQGENCICLYRGEGFQQRATDQYVLRAHLKEDWQMFMQACNDTDKITRVVHLWSLDRVAKQPPLDALAKQTHQACHTVLHLLHCLPQFNIDIKPSLTFVFEHMHGDIDDSEPCEVFQAPLWGMARTLANEHPEYRCRLIDIDAYDRQRFSQLLYDELWAQDNEREVAYRNGQRYVHRMRKIPKFDPQKKIDSEVEYCLDIKNRGTLENLYFREKAAPIPGDNDVIINVAAAGLNFRDILKAMGMYPSTGDEAFFLGDEFAGTVTAIGAAVTELRVGDKVFGTGQSCFGTSVVTQADFVAKKPSHLSMQEAATFPMVYLTVLYALEHLAQLQKGEKILIHAAAGGVGLAALQYAQYVGAEVIATAGTPEKRDYLRSLGVLHVFDSRSLSFYKEIYQLTEGRGVDVVLNSLAGNLMAKSLELLSEYGRFLELGKRDIYNNSPLGLRILRNNISYHAIDLIRLFVVKPHLVKALMHRISELIDNAGFKPTYYKTYPITNAVEAFRAMAQGLHQGKIVLEVQSQKTPPITNSQQVVIKTDGAYIITGGLGGFGLLVANWLAQQGAGEIILMGRHAQSLPPHTQQYLANIQNLGTAVTLFQGDVCREDDIAKLIDIAQQKHALRGIFHLAMVLDDALLTQMTPEQLDVAIDPKVLGAWNLHQASAAKSLDYFVLFSSINSLLGIPGQANYIAGNYFLDRLSEYRQQQGLPSTTVNWGVLSQIGYVATNQQVREKLDYQGFKPISPTEALAILALAMSNKLSQVGALDIDRERWIKHAPVSMSTPQYQLLVNNGDGSDSVNGDVDSQIDIMSVAQDQRLAIIEDSLTSVIVKVFRIERNIIDKHKSLLDLGLDSLVSVEIRNWIQKNFDVEISLMELMKGISIAELVKKIDLELSS